MRLFSGVDFEHWMNTMKYPFALIFCAMLSACGGGGGGGTDSAGSGSLGAATYSGTGIGIWHYDNSSGSAESVNINIAGVSAGKTATLVFSNGSAGTATQPGSGALASRVSPEALADAGIPLGAASAHQHGQDDAHAGMLARNRAAAAGLIRERQAAGPAADLTSRPAAAAALASFAPALGTTRSWNDNFDGFPVRYATSVQAVCELPSGRHVVWWVDPNVVYSGTFSSTSSWQAALGRLQAAYCGNAGGLARINSLLGDVWGPAASGYASSIHDGPFLQDINVVVLDVPGSSQWAGYFFGEDTKLKSSFSGSNEALAFFINASQVANDIDFTASTLLHETTHMVNFYQRAVAKGVVHDTWLEETTAMMTEDIIAPAVIAGGYNKALSDRLPGYLASGGNVSYINWPTLTSASAHYGMGAGFGAFLNRRYGLSIYKKLVYSCGRNVPATSALTSQECLDGLIRDEEGEGFGDEFARFGATLFGRFPAVGAPSGYGYPVKPTDEGYKLQAKDLSVLPLASSATPTSRDYKATSHIFRRDTISTGSSYVRSGVVVPANTSLTVIVQ